MSHNYETLTKLVTRWLDRMPKGPRADMDICCDLSHDGRDECIYWRRFGRPAQRPMFWREPQADLVVGAAVGPDAYFSISARGENRYAHVSGVVAKHCRDSGGRYCEISLNPLLQVLGENPEFFHGSQCAELRLIHQACEVDGRPLSLVEFRGRRILVGCDELYSSEYYVEVDRSFSTVFEAFNAMTPAAILEVKAAGVPYFRHGNWFLVQRSKEICAAESRLMRKDYALSEGGQPSRHVANRGYESNGRQWVTGMLRHPRFLRLQLDGLWEAMPALTGRRALG